MNKTIVSARAIGEKAMRELGLSADNKMYFIKTKEELVNIKDMIPDSYYVQAHIDNRLKGLATNNGTAFIFLYNITGLDSKMATEFTIYHEARHLWQYANGFKFSSPIMPYEYKAEEIDANKYASGKVSTNTRLKLIGKCFTVGCAIGGVLGMLIKNSTKKEMV